MLCKRAFPVLIGLAAGFAVCGAFLNLRPATAAVTAEDRRELTEIQRLIGKISSAIRRNKLDEAEQLLDEADKRLEAFAKKTELPPENLLIARTKQGIDRQRDLLSRRKGNNTPNSKAAQGVSFKEHVAPILVSRCGNCHGQRASGGLKLATFADMRRGGRSGVLLVPGAPQQSLIMQRLVSATNRMPKEGPPLAPVQLQIIYRWIQEGAKFDGPNENTPLADLAKGGDPNKPKEDGGPPVEIAMATGNESVSFVKDIAPSLVTLCLGCHSGNEPRGGLSMETFEKLMRGGDSGRVLLPGNIEGSRLFRLVGARELPRMPQGQARITRKWFADLQTWIREGLKYDGKDPKIPLRELVPTEEEKKAMELANLSPQQFAELREERTAAAWKRAAPRETAEWLRTDEFYLYGNVGEARLKQIGDWAQEYAKQLREMFPVQGERIWPGRLAVIVFRDRFGYSEFNIVIENREVPKEVIGHAKVAPPFEDAYVVLQDVGDVADASGPNLRISLVDQLTAAFLSRTEATLPEWVTRGTGLAMASRLSPAPSFFEAQRQVAKDALRNIDPNKPEEIFAKGKFSPAEIGPVGYTLVEFMLKNGGQDRFGRFITALQRGDNVTAAVKATYPPTELKALGSAFLASFAR